MSLVETIVAYKLELVELERAQRELADGPSALQEQMLRPVEARVDQALTFIVGYRAKTLAELAAKVEVLFDELVACQDDDTRHVLIRDTLLTDIRRLAGIV